MPRFKNSNRIGAEQMAYVATPKARKAEKPQDRQSYFRRIGFDFAMI